MRRMLMIKKKRGSIQLSMQFIMMLIIGIVIFVLSLYFLKDFFVSVNELKATLDQQTRSKIESMLNQDARVAIPFERQDVKKGYAEKFGIGIRNEIANQEYFLIELKRDGAFLPIDEPDATYDLICENSKCHIDGYNGFGYIGEDTNSYIVGGQNGKIIIENHKKEVIGVAIQALKSAPPGHFIFNIAICSQASSYPNNCDSIPLYDGSINKLHLIVK